MTERARLPRANGETVRSCRNGDDTPALQLDDAPRQLLPAEVAETQLPERAVTPREDVAAVCEGVCAFFRGEEGSVPGSLEEVNASREASGEAR